MGEKLHSTTTIHLDIGNLFENHFVKIKEGNVPLLYFLSKIVSSHLLLIYYYSRDKNNNIYLYI
nr:MAG TPA: hypothetical protein [Caudoviricetes sp.]